MTRLLLLVFSLLSLNAQVIAPEGFRGSVPSGEATAGPLRLSLQDAIDRGLKTNIGLLLRGSDSSLARAERLRALSALLPNVNGRVSEVVAQNNLKTFGFSGPNIPEIVGPFNYFDAHMSASSPVFDGALIKRLCAAEENARAAQLSVDDGRDLVVAAVASGYFAVLADLDRVEVTQSQLNLSLMLYNMAKDSHRAGTVPAIDELRAEVESKKQEQLLLASQNQLAKDKLALARVIGLAPGQTFEPTDTAPYQALEQADQQQLLDSAFQSRADYRSLEAQVRASEIQRKAADAQWYPTLSVAGYYGDVGPTPGNSHGVFNFTGTLEFRVFDGKRIRADQDAADAVIQHRKDELADLRGKIDFEVRNALLDLKNASDQVALARTSLGLATETLNQARDRYAAGVGSGLELVEAQVSLARANQDVIVASYAHNLAKVQLARAVGATETNLKQFIVGHAPAGHAPAARTTGDSK